MKEIVQDGAKVLREIAKPVPEELFGSAELARIIDDMEKALDQELEGVALAAPQIDIPYRIFIVRTDRTVIQTGDKQQTTNKPEIEIYINPEIIKTSRKRADMDEGCLSVRGIYGTTKRHERATVRARRQSGKIFERGGGGIMAQIFEHEIDHLNGILFIDHANRLVSVPTRVNGSVKTHRQKNENSFRFVYFGTPKVASDTLEILIEHGFVPSVVVTSPDAPRGRGLTLAPSETKACALAHDILVFTPEKLDTETIALIQAYKCEYAVCVAYGKIFPETLINIFPLGILNVHYSLLPKYRGATPLEAALLAGDSTTGITIQKMVKELDAGDIIAQIATTITPEETAHKLRTRLIELGTQLLINILPAYLSGDITPVMQDASLASHSRKLKKENGLLDLAASASENWNKYRAYADTIGTYFFKNGKRVKITVATFKNGEFIIERVIPEGKNEMDYQASGQNKKRL